jgi:flagellar assembly factor FliW
MIIEGTRFGALEYTDEDIVTFADGLIGFPLAQRFVLLSMKEDSPFRWLQSLDEPALAFLVGDPGRLVEGYAPVVPMHSVSHLDITEETPRLVYATVAIPAGRPDEMTMNLAGPILINALTRAAAQVVLEDDAYTIRHRVFQSASQVSESVAA